MPLLNLTTIPLPDLDDTTLFPVVAHAPICTDTWAPTRTCFLTPLHRLRPYGLPTEPLARLTFPWARRNLFRVPVVPLVPPSLGTKCPTLVVDEVDFNTGNVANFEMTVEKGGGDACQPVIVPTITFPCTQIESGGKTVIMVPGGDEGSWVQTPDNQTQPVSCLTILNDVLTIPCSRLEIGSVTTSFGSDNLSGSLTLTTSQTGCNPTLAANLSLTSTGGAGVSAGFFVGETGEPDESSTCVVSYPPDSIVPVFDRYGLLGDPETQLDPVENVFTNKSNNTLTDGDPIFLSQLAEQTVGEPVQWVVL